MQKVSKGLIVLLQAIIITTIIALGHFGIWQYFNHEVNILDADSVVSGFAYSPYRKEQNPLKGDRPSDEQIR